MTKLLFPTKSGDIIQTLLKNTMSMSTEKFVQIVSLKVVWNDLIGSLHIINGSYVLLFSYLVIQMKIKVTMFSGTEHGGIHILMMVSFSFY